MTSTKTVGILNPQIAEQARDRLWQRPAQFWPTLEEHTSDLAAPLGVLFLPALLANAQDVLRRTKENAVPHAKVPTVRIGSKSIRSREVLHQLLKLEGIEGVFGYSLAEALYLWRAGIEDIVIGYPSADKHAIAALCGEEGAAEQITLMIDDPAQLDFIDAQRSPQQRPTLRICLDMDMSFELPSPLPRIGVWRSPLHTPEQVRALAEQILRRPGFELTGILGYEAQIAGVADRPADQLRGIAVRQMQRRSKQDVLARRGRAVELVREIAELRFVNGGGSGSINSTSADPSVTEVTVGSAFTAPHLFDHYEDFHPAPATSFALDVVRTPSPDRATLLGGGWIASGPTGKDRYPALSWPEGLRYEALEGPGEVQTPVRSAGRLKVGDRVWLRHTKGGELAEHLNHYAVVSADGLIDQWATYRGEGKAFL